MLLKAGMALDRRLLPYDLSARAARIESTVDEAELLAAGAAPSAVERLTEAVAGFKGAATAYDARAASIPSGARANTSRLLMKVAKAINRNFTALDWGDNTVYPHQQVLWDLQAVNSALAALQAASFDPAWLLGSLIVIGLPVVHFRFSPLVYSLVAEPSRPRLLGHQLGGTGAPASAHRRLARVPGHCRPVI